MLFTFSFYCSAQEPKSDNSEISVSVITSDIGDAKKTLKFDFGEYADSLPSDLSVRIYRDIFKVFEAPLNNSVSEFIMEPSNLNIGENILDVTFFSPGSGSVVLETKLRVFRSDRYPIVDIDDYAGMVPKQSKYVSLCLSVVGFAGIASQIALRLGPVLYHWWKGSDSFIIPIFEPIATDFPAIGMGGTNGVAAAAAASVSNPDISLINTAPSYLPIVIGKFAFTWLPRIAVLVLGGLKGWAAFSTPAVTATAAATAAAAPVVNNVIAPTAKNFFVTVAPRFWRSAIVTVVTIGLKVLAMTRGGGGGRVFHQHIGAHDVQRLF